VKSRDLLRDVERRLYTINTDGTGLAQVTHDGGDDPDWGLHPPVE
jgi:hypothetical protein